ncbi:MAG: glucosamine-6-phosphate deaminase [Planctomycetes bacterium]|nr:glucosamine-6-phosphate deaminase [Planctomycetota bacterium]
MAAATKSFKADQLAVKVYATVRDLAADAAQDAQKIIKEAIAAKGSAAAILATGNSQLEFLDAWVKLGGLDWSKVTLFHMDEYLGLPDSHSASFRKYMKERVEAVVKPKAFHYVIGDGMEPIKECDEYERKLRAQPIDLCCLGIGENGHLAFNDPPVADFADKRYAKIVKLDTACRQQQVGEGHFKALNDVPQYAISLTIPALCAAKRMMAIVPEKRKAAAVKGTLKGPVSTDCPGSFLRTQAHCTLYLDADSASQV